MSEVRCPVSLGARPHPGGAGASAACAAATRPRRWHAAPARLTVAGLILASTLAAPLAGCRKGESERQEAAAAPSNTDTGLIPPPPERPSYSFAPGLRERHREVCGFVQQFLETCLAGDYSGYRKLVSRARSPESRERFAAIYYAIRRVVVDEIRTVPLAELPAPAYLVISTIEFLPERQAQLRRANRQIAIIAFKEEGQWRIVPAPAQLQPQDPAEAPTSAPASGPVYPWEEFGSP